MRVWGIQAGAAEGFRGQRSDVPGSSGADVSHAGSRCPGGLRAPCGLHEADDEALRMFSLLLALAGKGMRLEDSVIPRQPSPSTETTLLPFRLGKTLSPFHERWLTGCRGHSQPLASCGSSALAPFQPLPRHRAAVPAPSCEHAPTPRAPHLRERGPEPCSM